MDLFGISAMESVKSHRGEPLSIYAITISKHYCNTNELITYTVLIGNSDPGYSGRDAFIDLTSTSSHPIDWPLFSKLVNADVFYGLYCQLHEY